jgi:hypothetical protein
MKTAIAVLGLLKGLDDNLVLAHLPFLDSVIYPDNILVDDTSGTNVEMSNFRVAHKALGETDSGGRSLQLSVS